MQKLSGNARTIAGLKLGCGGPFSEPSDQKGLTPSEKECLTWIAAGKTDWEVGCITKRSERTVHHLISSALRKFGVANRPQLVAEGFRRGLLR